MLGISKLNFLPTPRVDDFFYALRPAYRDLRLQSLGAIDQDNLARITDPVTFEFKSLNVYRLIVGYLRLYLY